MSINAQDLRIGNWIRYSLHFLQVTELRKQNEVATNEHINGALSEYDGIRLTPEILVALGITSKNYYDSKYENRISDKQMDVVLEKRGDSFIWLAEDGGSITKNPFQYLHQFQNIFWVLYNEELPIDINKLKQLI